MERVANKVSQTRKNWYNAFKLACNIKGYEYYQPPDEIRYRYPSPGSVALDKDSYPHLFKKHWKTPFRDSPYNIRGIEKRVPDEVNDRYFIEAKVEWDPVTEAHMAGQQQPDQSHL